MRNRVDIYGEDPCISLGHASTYCSSTCLKILNKKIRKHGLSFSFLINIAHDHL